MATPSSSSASFPCEHCGELFHRREHRNRHQLRHTGVKPFACTECDKSFSRNDTLLRHRALHRKANTRSPRNAESATGLGRRRVQACLQCAKVKQRCEGGSPCARCSLRKSVCSYGSSTMSASQREAAASSSQPSWISNDSDECDADNDLAPGSMAGTAPLLDAEPLTFDIPLEQDVTSDTTLHNVDIPYDAMAIDYSLPWTMPWAIEGLDLPIETSNISLPWNSANSSATRDQSYLSPQYICSRHVMPCRPFPKPGLVSLDIAGAENYGHVSYIPEQGFEELHAFYRTQQLDAALSPTMPRRILHAFIELYFEHFDPHFPFLHPSRLEAENVPWILLLATAAVGSHYSEVEEAPKYHAVLFELLNRATESAISARLGRTDIVVIQVVLLLHVLWMFSESHRDKIVQHHKRSILATLCRDLLGKGDKHSNSHQAEGAPERAIEHEWENWLSVEEQIRTLSCVRGDVSPMHRVRRIELTS